MLEIDENTVREGEMREVVVDGKEALVAKVNGNIYAIGGRCTHLRCHLYQGKLEGTVVTCPCHGTRFDVTTGKMLEPVTKWPKLIGKAASVIIRDEEVFAVESKDGKVRISKQ
jgi:nitrite reductase/ring-hydroxylating ferredoxin subunit